MEAGSWIRRMFEDGIAMKQRYGADNVFDLSLGNPVMEPPAGFVRELRELAASPVPRMHGYMENAGYPETRAAEAGQLARETGVNVTAQDIIMTCGAAGAVNVAFKAILNPGDEVILFSPYFVDYHNYIYNGGGVPVVVPTGDDFMPRLDALEDAIGPKTKALLINSPNNPTGVVYGDSLMGELGALLQRQEARYGTEIYLVSDEPYRRIIYDGLSYPSPLNHCRRSIVVTSHSKDLSVAGERIGYLALHPDSSHHDDMVTGFVFCTRVLGFINAPAFMQNVVRRLQGVSIDVSEYQRHRDFIYDNLVGMGYQVNRPQGAFYIFPRCPIKDDVAFVYELQNEYRVLTVPGVAFGAPGYFRLVYCVDDRVLEASMPGLAALAKKYKSH
jgi:aspartate aminotransferase